MTPTGHDFDAAAPFQTLDDASGKPWAEVEVARSRDLVRVLAPGGEREPLRIEIFEAEGLPLARCTLRCGGREKPLRFEGGQGPAREAELSLELPLALPDGPAWACGRFDLAGPELEPWGRVELGAGRLVLFDRSGRQRLELRAGAPEGRAAVPLSRRGRAVASLRVL